MAAEEGESLESLLNRATNPVNRNEDWDFIMAFCDQINKELEGPQISVRLLSHKIQSPQEREALYALATLEACVKNCGRRFHQEIGKFRFLNEMIKVVSPKYLGNHTTEKVKTRCVELLYSWSKGLSSETKIAEAYSMLKKQGIVTQDPVHIDQTIVPQPSPQPKNAVFEDEDKSKLLARLLKSKHPDDLQAANRLIKNMVKQDSERMDKVSRRMQQLETVNNNIKLLGEMLNYFSTDRVQESEVEVMKELYDNLEKARPNLFRLASDTDDKDSEGISQILKANDDVLKIMERYNDVIKQNGTSDRQDKDGTSLLDLSPGSPSYLVSDSLHFTPGSGSSGLLVDEQLNKLGLIDMGGDSVAKQTDASGSKVDFDELGDIFRASSNNSSFPTASTGPADIEGLLDLGAVIPPPRPAMTNNPSYPFQAAGGAIPTAHSLPPVGSTYSGLPDVGLLTNVSWSQPPNQKGTITSSGQTGVLPTYSLPSAGTGMNSSPSMGQGSPWNAAPLTGMPVMSQTTNVDRKQQQQQQQPAKSSGLEALDELGKSLLQQSLPAQAQALPVSQPSRVPLNKMNQMPAAIAPPPPPPPPSTNSSGSAGPAVNGLLDSGIGSASGVLPALSPPSSATASPSRKPATAAALSPAKPVVEVQPLTDITVSLETIKPTSEGPFTAYEKNGLKVVLHLGKDRPRPDVQVMVVSVVSTNATPIKNFVFQAAVPKVMKVKLQPPSATDLPEFNPILPPSAITQVLLLANPHQEKIRLKYKLSYNMDTAQITDVGEMDNIPIH